MPTKDKKQAALQQSSADFVLSVRAVDANGQFIAEVGAPQFLVVPDTAEVPTASMSLANSDLWAQQVISAASWKNDQGEQRGDILFIVHGYNMSEAEVLERHRLLKNDFCDLQYKGTIVSFDWPSDNKTLGYWDDRHRAQQTAMQLVDSGIRMLSAKQIPTCPINVHILAHSTGAFVVREGFSDADNTNLTNQSWMVSQLVFIAGDVSAASMSIDDRVSASVYHHCVRMTNYSNRWDEALDLSNIKRLGTAARVGRIGLPADVPAIAVNVDCSDYYGQLSQSKPMQKKDQPNGFKGLKSHSWYFGNKKFAQDLFSVVIGTDRLVMSTREIVGGKLLLA